MFERKVLAGVVGAALVVSMAGMAWQPAKEKDKPRNPNAATPAQPAKKDETKPAGQPSEQEMMEAWMKAATPGPNHELLATFGGTWKGVVSMWMDPSAPPEKSEGSMVNTVVLGGRYLRQEWTGEMMGGPFEGVGYWGYDNLKKEFVSTWIDSASTGVMMSRGQYDAGKKVFTLTGSSTDPITGKDSIAREVITIVNANEHRMDMYGPGPDGKETKMMEIVYTRTADGDKSAPAKVGN